MLGKKKEERRGVNATKLFEVEIRTLVPVEPVVELFASKREDETSVNQVKS